MRHEVKRVPLGFEWPLGRVWGGYVRPALPRCEECAGTGYSPVARALDATFYPSARVPAQLAWHDKLTQAEVDELGRLGRLPEGNWGPGPHVATAVNAMQRVRGPLDGHDAPTRHILVSGRCKRLDSLVYCLACDGIGTSASDGERAAAAVWERTDPPGGDGWQLWETTAGSPLTPVFPTLDELCAYAAEHCVALGSHRVTAEEWREKLARRPSGGGQ